MKVILTPPPPFNGNFPLIDIFYSLCLPLPITEMTRRLIRNNFKAKGPPAAAALPQQQEQEQFLMR